MFWCCTGKAYSVLKITREFLDVINDNVFMLVQNLTVCLNRIGFKL